MQRTTDGPKHWQTQWEHFIEDVVADFVAGMTDREVTGKYSSTQVTWTGVVSDVTLSNPRSSVQMEMPRVAISLDNGVNVEVDYLSLQVEDSDKAAWLTAKIGDVVQFTTNISKGIEPFPGIEWSEHESEASILIGTDHSKVVSIRSR